MKEMDFRDLGTTITKILALVIWWLPLYDLYALKLVCIFLMWDT